MAPHENQSLVRDAIKDHLNVCKGIDSILIDKIIASADIISEKLTLGKTLYICGNGGSASDSQHFAAELVCKFNKDRLPLRAVALTTDSSIITSISNDYSFEDIFSRQVEALGKEGDCIIAISTSGKSQNIIQAVEAAKKIGMHSIALTGLNGGDLSKEVDISINIPSKITAIIQEMHILVIHLLCITIENNLGFA